jgi:hypothetical protein
MIIQYPLRYPEGQRDQTINEIRAEESCQDGFHRHYETRKVTSSLPIRDRTVIARAPVTFLPD